MAFCQNCGTEINKGANFCPNCGKAAGAAATSGTAKSKTEKQTAEKSSAGGSTDNTGIAAKLESFSQALAERKKSAANGGIEFFGIELLENFLAVLKKFKITTGRASRKEFWMFALACFIIGVVFSMLATIPILGVIFRIASFAFGLVTIIPSIAVGVRRLHDTDKSGKLMLLLLIPLVGWIIVIVFYVKEGTPGENKYGPQPGVSYDLCQGKFEFLCEILFPLTAPAPFMRSLLVRPKQPGYSTALSNAEPHTWFYSLAPSTLALPSAALQIL
jgi:uncharacterized membrane protein YhaH (DUF805 family)